MWRNDSKKEQILTEAKEETTRLGENWVWTTDLFVQREGKAKRNPIKEIDEADIKGAEKGLIMEQTYTRGFQCVFMLSNYPFDTQVPWSGKNNILPWFVNHLECLNLNENSV